MIRHLLESQKPKIMKIPVSIILLAFLLASCAPVPMTTETGTVPTTYSSLTPTLLPVTATKHPTLPVAMTANPDQLVQWQEYERALVSRLFFLHPPEEILCEWEILGREEDKVYVWAICLGLPPNGESEKWAPMASIPAAILLDSDGSIQSVELPRDSGKDYGEGIRILFPPAIRTRISERSISISTMAEHVKLRRKKPGPPLIVLMATPQP